MPIKGLTDRVTPSYPMLGKLRKGGEKQNRTKDGKEYQIYGLELDHFRFTSERAEVVTAFQAVYGEAPKLVTCFLPYKGLESNFSTWKEAWKAGGLVHRCDGETMNLWIGKDGKYQTDAKPCTGGCDEVGRLIVILPELIRAGYVGYVCMETHSINDIRSITATLMAVAEARMGDERGLRGIEFNLRRVPERISTPGENGGRVRRLKWLVKIEPSPDWTRLQLNMAEGTPQLPEPEETEAGVEATAETSADEIDAPLDGAQITEQPATTQPEPTEQTWMKDSRRGGEMGRLWAWYKDAMGLSQDGVHELLMKIYHVEHHADIPNAVTLEIHKKAIEDYLQGAEPAEQEETV